MEERKRPQPRDKVRVTVVGEAVTVGTGGWMKLAVGEMPGQPNGGELALPLSGGGITVEVLEPADDPSKDPVGTFRREDHEDGYSIWQKIEDSLGRIYWWCTFSTVEGNKMTRVDDPDLVDTRVIGALPGSPADRPAVTVEEVEQIGQLLADNQSGRDPQVFTFPGPQPPASVTTLEWLDSNPDARDYQFLHRVGDGWLWWDRATPPEKWSAAPNSWDRAARTSPGRYREVV